MCTHTEKIDRIRHQLKTALPEEADKLHDKLHSVVLDAINVKLNTLDAHVEKLINGFNTQTQK